MTLRADTRARSLGTTLLLWGLGLLGALFVLSIVVGMVISIISTVVAVVTTVATALLLCGIAYLVASWAFGGSTDDERVRGGKYDFERTSGRHTDEIRSNRAQSGSLLDRVPGFGDDGDADREQPPSDPIDRLTDQYVRGEIGEAEYERRLERQLDGSSAGSVDEFETVRNREYER